MVRLTDRPNMTIAVYWDVKQQNKTKNPCQAGLLVGDSLPAVSLCCILEQDTLSSA